MCNKEEGFVTHTLNSLLIWIQAESTIEGGKLIYFRCVKVQYNSKLSVNGAE